MSLRRIAVPAAAGVALVVVGAFALDLGSPDVDPGSPVASDAAVGVGDCLDVLEGQDPDPASAFPVPPAQRVDCADPQAAYRVAMRLDGLAACPAPIYILRPEGTGPADASTLCMTFNVDEGECFVQAPTEAGPFDCSEGPRAGAIEILRRVDGVADAARCADLDSPGVLAAVIPDPAITFCYADFAAGGGGPVLDA